MKNEYLNLHKLEQSLPKLLLLIVFCLLFSKNNSHIYFSNQCSDLLSPMDIMSRITFMDFDLNLTFNNVAKASLIKLPNLSNVSFGDDLLNSVDKKNRKDPILKKEYNSFSFKISTGDLLTNKSSTSSESFGEIFYEKFKYSIKNIYIKFPSEHMISGLGYSMELQFEAFTSQDQSLIFVKLLEAVEDFENPSLDFLNLGRWSSLKDYQTLPLTSVDFNSVFSPQQTFLSSITGKIEYIPKTFTDEVIEYSEMIPEYFNENQRPFKEEKEFYFYTGQSCLLYTSPSPRDLSTSRMPSSA